MNKIHDINEEKKIIEIDGEVKDNDSYDLVINKEIIEIFEKEAERYKIFYQKETKKILLDEIIDKRYNYTKEYVEKIHELFKNYLKENENNVNEFDFEINFLQKIMKNINKFHIDLSKMIIEYLNKKTKEKIMEKYIEKKEDKKIEKKKLKKYYISRNIQRRINKEENEYINKEYKNFLIFIIILFFQEDRITREKVLFEKKLKILKEAMVDKKIVRLNNNQGIIISIKENSLNFDDSIKIKLYNFRKKEILTFNFFELETYRIKEKYVKEINILDKIEDEIFDYTIYTNENDFFDIEMKISKRIDCNVNNLKIIKKEELDFFNVKAILEGTILDMMFIISEFPKIKIEIENKILREIFEELIQKRREFFENKTLLS